MIVLLGLQPLECLDAEYRHQQRTAEMGKDDRRSPCVLAAQQQRDGLCRKSRESRQPAEEAGDDEQPPLRRQPRMLYEESHGNADQITADQIGSKRAMPPLRQRRVET